MRKQSQRAGVSEAEVLLEKLDYLIGDGARDDEAPGNAYIINALSAATGDTIDVLEVGCGASPLAYAVAMRYCLLNNKRLNYTAIELDDTALAEYGRQCDDGSLERPRLLCCDAQDLVAVVAAMQGKRADAVVMHFPICENPADMPAANNLRQYKRQQAEFAAGGKSCPDLDRTILQMEASAQSLARQYRGISGFFKVVLPAIVKPTGVFSTQVCYPEEYDAMRARRDDFSDFAVAASLTSKARLEVVLRREIAPGVAKVLETTGIANIEGANLSKAIRTIARYGTVQQLALLISLPDANIDAADTGANHYTPLHHAAMSTVDSADKMKLLSVYGADQSLVTAAGKTARELRLEALGGVLAAVSVAPAPSDVASTSDDHEEGKPDRVISGR